MIRSHKRPFWDEFTSHRRSARERGIEFLLSYEEWYAIWYESGRLHERGRCRGQYVMARFNDTGPYATWNVKIILCQENTYEGSSGRVHTAESRNRISLANRGRRKPQRSPEHCAKISTALKDRPRSPETRAQISRTLKGRIISPETRARMSAAKKGIPKGPLSQEVRMKISAAKKGHDTMPAEKRALLTEFNRGKSPSDATRARMSNSQRGRRHPLETRSKMSEAQRKRWAKIRQDKELNDG